MRNQRQTALSQSFLYFLFMGYSLSSAVWTASVKDLDFRSLAPDFGSIQS